MQEAFASAADAATPMLRLSHRVGDRASALGAARRAFAANGTNQRTPRARFHSKCRFASCRRRSEPLVR